MNFKTEHGIQFQREDDRGLVEIRYENPKMVGLSEDLQKAHLHGARRKSNRETALRGYSSVMIPEINWVRARG